MLYFKTVSFPDQIRQPEVEKSLRKYSIKESVTLDLKVKAVNIGTDKLFFGLESKKSLSFTRIRTSFEFLIPKLIINLSKDETSTGYMIRLSTISFFVFMLLSFGMLAFIISLFGGQTDISGGIIFIFGLLVFFLLFKLELNLTKSRVLKSINRER